MQPIDHNKYPLSTEDILRAMSEGIIRNPTLQISSTAKDGQWPGPQEDPELPFIKSQPRATSVHLEDGTQLIDPSRLLQPAWWGKIPLDAAAPGDASSDLEGASQEGATP